jgi:hypothetical protein
MKFFFSSQNEKKTKVNKHVHDIVMMNVGLMMMMMVVVVVVMVNDDVIDYHYVNHDDDHDLDLLNVDFVVDIV